MTMPEDGQHADDTPPLDFRKRILAQFQTDLNQPSVCHYDVEFISTYFDQQLHFFMPSPEILETSINNFEAHLVACPPCHTRLGNFDTLREAYRAYCYRIEEQLETWTVRPHVMQKRFAPHSTNVLHLPFVTRRIAWQAMAAAVVAGAVILIFPNPLTHQYQADPSAPLTAALPSPPAPSLLATDVAYQTPEAYLFSKDSDPIPDDTLNPSQNESVIALNTGRI